MTIDFEDLVMEVAKLGREGERELKEYGKK